MTRMRVYVFREARGPHRWAVQCLCCNRYVTMPAWPQAMRFAIEHVKNRHPADVSP